MELPLCVCRTTGLCASAIPVAAKGCNAVRTPAIGLQEPLLVEGLRPVTIAGFCPTPHSKVLDLKKQVRLGSVNAKLLQSAVDRAEALHIKVQCADAQLLTLKKEHDETLVRYREATLEAEKLARREVRAELCSKGCTSRRMGSF